jgi:predicted nuclease with TOPRIM domain
MAAAPAGLVTGLSAALAESAIPASTLLAATQTLAMTTLQKAIVAAALTAAVGTGLYAVHHSSQLTAEIRALRQDQAPLTAKLQRLEQEGSQASNQLAALREENARLKSGQKETELLKLRGEVGMLRRRAVSSQTQSVVELNSWQFRLSGLVSSWVQ